jgi:uncharacterized membrane protein (DUF485 family)
MPRNFDWEGIERSADFRALVSSKRRFIVVAGTTMMGLALLYVIVAAVAPDVLAVSLGGSIALGWVAGCALLVTTWLVCLAYIRRSDREWEPLAQKIVRDAGEPTAVEEGDRFSRTGARAAGPERTR